MDFHLELNFATESNYPYTNQQKWKMTEVNYRPLADGVYEIGSSLDTNKVIDYPYKAAENRLCVYEKNSLDHQFWNIKYNNERRAYRIINEYNKNRSIVWNSKHNNDVLGWHTYDNYIDQYWRLERNPNSSGYMIRNLRNMEMIICLPNNQRIQVAWQNNSNKLNKPYQTWIFTPRN